MCGPNDDDFCIDGVFDINMYYFYFNVVSQLITELREEWCTDIQPYQEISYRGITTTIADVAWHVTKKEYNL